MSPRNKALTAAVAAVVINCVILGWQAAGRDASGVLETDVRSASQPQSPAAESKDPKVRVFAAKELLRHDDSAPLLLVVVGEVYDVSSGESFYGPGSSYEGFANGTDASRAFLTSDFDNNATDDLDGLLPGECLGIEHWVNFYANHAKYTFAGLLHGRFYDEQGEPTEALDRFRACIAQGHAARASAQQVCDAAPRCTKATPAGEPRFSRGRWATFTCEPPLAPRRLTHDGDVCVCLEPKAVVDGGFEPEALGMKDDGRIPQQYDTNMPADASQVTVRVG